MSGRAPPGRRGSGVFGRNRANSKKKQPSDVTPASQPNDTHDVTTGEKSSPHLQRTTSKSSGLKMGELMTHNDSQLEEYNPAVSKDRFLADSADDAQTATTEHTIGGHHALSLRLALIQFYVCYSPEKLVEIPALLRKHMQHDTELKLQLRRDYQQVPMEKEASLCMKLDPRTRMMVYFAHHNPSKVPEGVDMLLKKYWGQEDELWAALEAKYGPEPQLHLLFEEEEEAVEHEIAVKEGRAQPHAAPPASKKKSAGNPAPVAKPDLVANGTSSGDTGGSTDAVNNTSMVSKTGEGGQLRQRSKSVRFAGSGDGDPRSPPTKGGLSSSMDAPFVESMAYDPQAPPMQVNKPGNDPNMTPMGIKPSLKSPTSAPQQQQGDGGSGGSATGMHHQLPPALQLEPLSDIQMVTSEPSFGGFGDAGQQPFGHGDPSLNASSIPNMTADPSFGEFSPLSSSPVASSHPMVGTRGLPPLPPNTANAAERDQFYGFPSPNDAATPNRKPNFESFGGSGSTTDGSPGTMFSPPSGLKGQPIPPPRQTAAADPEDLDHMYTSIVEKLGIDMSIAQKSTLHNSRRAANRKENELRQYSLQKSLSEAYGSSGNMSYETGNSMAASHLFGAPHPPQSQQNGTHSSSPQAFTTTPQKLTHVSAADYDAL